MSTTRQRAHDDETTGTAVGISVFAGVVLATLATFEFLQGLAAVLEDEVFIRGIDYTYKADLTTWGWVHMILGAIGVAVGLGLLMSQLWSFYAGIVIAVLSALGQFAFMPYYPLWSLLIISLDILVIWALAKLIGNA